MIQFKRGSKATWLTSSTPLADGQPGYDRSRNKIKIGDGKKLWSELKYASGLSEEEVLDKESNAKKRIKADPDDKTIITYGTSHPDDTTVGQLYLQYYSAEPEVDYVVDYGVSGIWSFRKWHSGRAECVGTLKLSDTVEDLIDDSTLYCDNQNMKAVAYPFKFTKVPCEIASVVSPGNLVWLASRDSNTKTASAVYSVVSADRYANSANYIINIKVEGSWR